jgi:3',5'-cyclic AMP phosphodiesterase CpdA
MAEAPGRWFVERRDFLRVSAASLAGLVAFRGADWAEAGRFAAGVRFGVLTDAHHADGPSRGTRFYRESRTKVREAVTHLEAARVTFLAQLGDIKDMVAGESPARTLDHLSLIARETAQFNGPVYHVLGNHDMDNVSKPQALSLLRSTGVAEGRSFYSCRHGGVRFITLDACSTKAGDDYDRGNFDWRDANVPAAQLAWLRGELAASAEPVVVLAHQRLDGTGDVYVTNSLAVREALEASGKVLAVFQGHDHAGARSMLGGIHYYTLKAIVEGSGQENNAYAVVEVHPDLSISVRGYRKAESAEIARATK